MMLTFTICAYVVCSCDFVTHGADQKLLIARWMWQLYHQTDLSIIQL